MLYMLTLENGDKLCTNLATIPIAVNTGVYNTYKQENRRTDKVADCFIYKRSKSSPSIYFGQEAYTTVKVVSVLILYADVNLQNERGYYKTIHRNNYLLKRRTYQSDFSPIKHCRSTRKRKRS